MSEAVKEKPSAGAANLAEEKRNAILKASGQDDGPRDSNTISEQEEYRILKGKGVEYKTSGGLIVHIPPLKIKDFDLLYKIDEANASGKNTKEVLDIKLEIYSKILGIDLTTEENREKLDFDDLNEIHSIFAFVLLGKKSIYAQSSVKKKAIAGLRSIIDQEQQKISEGQNGSPST